MVEEAENQDTMAGEGMAGGEGALGHSYLHDSDVLAQHSLYSGMFFDNY